MAAVTRVISYPMRFGADRRVVTVESESSQGRAQRIAQLVMTEQGERPLAPEFGVRSVAWNRLSMAEVRLGVARFGPFDVQLTGVDTFDTETTQRLTIKFQDGEP